MRAAGWGGSFMAAALEAHLKVNPSEVFPYGDQDVLRIVQRHYPGDPPSLHPRTLIYPLCRLWASRHGCLLS